MKLQEYEGLIVDYRLRQFRTQPPDFGVIEFIDFKSDKGDALLCEMLAKDLVPWEMMTYLT